MHQKKYYVVRKGREIWIFTSRDKVESIVSGFPDAKYKSFPTEQQAQQALTQGREPYYEASTKKNLRKSRGELEDIPFIQESIAVDAACSGNPGFLEYRGVDLQTGNQIFHQQFEIWTNNVGEFLAIVHGLAHTPRPKAIYSDSKIALSRIQQGICKSKFRTTNPERTIRTTVEKAESRLKTHGIPSQLLKRNTQDRGEIPADFGRK